MAHISHLFSGYPNVNVQTYEGLTVTFCEQIKASHIVRGIRNSQDYEYEKSIAQMNKSLSGIETIFLLTEESVSPINSSIVREIHRNKGDISLFVTNPEILV